MHSKTSNIVYGGNWTAVEWKQCWMWRRQVETEITLILTSLIRTYEMAWESDRLLWLVGAASGLGFGGLFQKCLFQWRCQRMNLASSTQILCSRTEQCACPSVFLSHLPSPFLLPMLMEFSVYFSHVFVFYSEGFSLDNHLQAHYITCKQKIDS